MAIVRAYSASPPIQSAVIRVMRARQALIALQETLTWKLPERCMRLMNR